MRVYFTESQVPELTDLNRAQRKIVRRGALEMLRRDQPSFLGSVRVLTGVFVAVGMIIGLAVTHAIHAEHNWILRAIIVGIHAHVALVIVQTYMTEHLRPYFHSFVEQHRDEIVGAA